MLGLGRKIRAFLNAKDEILDRLTNVERNYNALKSEVSELYDFMHRAVRKRYQAEYYEKRPVSEPEPDDLPLLSSTNSGPRTPSKQELWNQARARLGPQRTKAQNE